MHTIILLDPDREFVERMMQYFRQSAFVEYITLFGFTETEAICTYFSKNPKYDLLVCSEEMYLLPVVNQRAEKILFLINDGFTTDYSNGLKMFKYLPADTHLQAWMKACESLVPRYIGKNGRESVIVSVYSSSGGTGKTTTAIRLAEDLTRSGKSVCLLNLEDVESTEMIDDDQSDERGDTVYMSHLLYQIQTKPDLSIESMIKRNKENFTRGYFAPKRTAGYQEMKEMTREDTTALLRKLALEGGFDAIVVDLAVGFHPRILGALDASICVLWMMIDHIFCLNKTHSILHELEQIDMRLSEAVNKASLFILNKRKGAVKQDFLRNGIRICAELPYVEETNLDLHLNHRISDGEYDDTLTNLIMKHVKKYQEGIR